MASVTGRVGVRDGARRVGSSELQQGGVWVISASLLNARKLP